MFQFHEKQFELRNKQSHEDQCSQLESDTCGETSKQYGINQNSVLNQLSYFHVCDGSLLPDVMHDILEGLLQYEMKLLLHVMIEEEGYFSLDYFNSCLDNLELGYMESKSRPTLISVRTFRSAGNSLKQTSMFCIYMYTYTYMCYIQLCRFVFSLTDVVARTCFATDYWRLCSR